MDTKKLTRQDILDRLPEHLKGRTLHIVGPEDDYDEEEDVEELDPEYAQMAVPDEVKNKREEIEKKEQASQPKQSNLRLTRYLKEVK
jgi:U3 small nucleolar RNA-associated protein 13